jgi:hypothetical protein
MYNVKEIMVHPFFRTINWQDLAEKKVSLMVISYSVSRQYMLSSVPIKCYNTALEIIE